MQKSILTTIAVATITTSSLAYSADAPVPAPANLQQQKQIEQVVHNYLVKNPEVIVESLQVLQQQQMDQARKSIEKTQALAAGYVDAIFHQAKDPVAGNPKGTVTIVDFFDYQCPHCVHMTPILDALIKANPNLRVVFKEFPIRGAASDFAAKAALAANMQGKYFDFHKALMQSLAQQQQPLTEDAVMQVAKSVGLNLDKLKADMKSDAVLQQIKSTYKLAQDLKLIGTPAFFIAKTDITPASKPGAMTFIPGQVEQAQFQIMLDKVSKS